MKVMPYEKYKPANSGWLNALPEGWDQIRGRFAMAVNPPPRRARVLDDTDEVSFVPMEAVGEYGGLGLERTKPLDEIGSGYTAFEDGDVVIAKITPCFENGKGAIASGLKNGVGFGTTELHVLRAGKRINKQFLFYLTISHTFRVLGESEMYGAGGQKRVPPEFAKDFRIPLPPVDEQQTIASFLDAKTAQIDALVVHKRQLIAKLKEKRQALIARTVTRGLPPEAAKAAGLEPNPEMKDSGVDWLGEIPAHWETMQLKQTWAICEYGISESLSGEGDIRVLTMGNIQDGRVTFPSAGCLENVLENMLLNDGDLLFNRTNSLAHVGKVGLYRPDEKGPVSFASYLVRIRPNSRTTPEFMTYMLNIPQLLSFARGLALPSINQANLNPTRYGQIHVALPSIQEQNMIVEYIDREASKVDRLTSEVEIAIARLTEYRQALITSAVTGKIDVRGWESELEAA